METKYTPGPWRAEGWENLVVNAATGDTIIAMPGGTHGATLGELKANARLIAAAPALLEACEAALDLLSHSYDTPSQAAIPQLRAAIAAAKGGGA